MKRWIVLYAALGFAGVRAYMAGTLAEWGTGFMPKEAGLFVIALLAAAAAAGWMWSCSVPDSLLLGEASEQRRAPSDRGAFLSVLSELIAAGGLLAGAVLSLVWRGRLWLLLTVSAAASAICLLLLVPAAAGRSLRGGPSAEGLLLLPVSIYGITALLCAYLAGTNLIYVQENTLTMLSCAALLLAVYSDSRCRVGFEPVRRTVFWLTAAAFLCTAAGLPMTVLRLTVSSVVTVTSAPGLDLVNACFSLFLWLQAAALCDAGDCAQNAQEMANAPEVEQ